MTFEVICLQAGMVRAQIRAMGMVACNTQNPDFPPYSEEDFNNIIDEEGIGYNPTIEAASTLYR